MIHYFDFIVLGLATYRLTLMITKESGPAWVFKHLRNLVSRKAPRQSHLDEGIKCPFCVSMWIAIILVAIYWPFGDRTWFMVPVIILALSAVAVICNQGFTQGKL